MQGKPDQPQTPTVVIVLLLLCGVYVVTNLRGCQSGPVYYKITGVVRVAGEPVEDVQVNFYSDDPNKPLASGRTNSDGWFALYSGVTAIEGCQETNAKVTFVSLSGNGGAEGRRGTGGRGAGDGPAEGDADGSGGERPARGVSSNGLQLAPDMPQPPFALEYTFTTTTPIIYDVTEDAHVEFDLLEFGSTEVPAPGDIQTPSTKEATPEAPQR